MSAKISGLVWELDLPRSKKIVLLALADHAKHDGSEVRPSIALIMWKTEYEKRAVQDIIAELRDVDKLLILVNPGGSGPGSTNEYKIDFTHAKWKPNFDEWKRQRAGVKPTQSQSCTDVCGVVQVDAGVCTEKPVLNDKGAENAPLGSQTQEPAKGAFPPKKGCISGEIRVHPSALETKALEPKALEPSPKTSSSEGKKVRKSKKKFSEPDPRHYPLVKAIQAAWVQKNSPAPTAPWDGVEASALKRLLKSNPSWTTEHLLRCVENRFKSEVNHGERPRIWIKHLLGYFASPIDKFKQPIANSDVIPGRAALDRRENLIDVIERQKKAVYVPPARLMN